MSDKKYMKKFVPGIIFLLLFSSRLLPQVNQISLSEKQEKIYLTLAESLFGEGQYNRALSVYLDFIDLYPDSTFIVRAMENMADLYEKMQLFDEALNIYRTLYQRTGTSSSKGLSYYYNQARILNSMGDIKQSGKIYDDIIKISPDSPYARKAIINNKINALFQN